MLQESRNIQEQVREIKQSFRLLMNGVTAQSMREKGVDYHLNWGANLLHLREMAKDYTPDHQLAQELWKENIRECKILATMLMPVDGFDYDLALLWIEQTHTQEIAEIACMNLYQKLPFAKELALQLIAMPDDLLRLHGFTILSGLFKNAVTGPVSDSPAVGLCDSSLDDRDINEFLDQAVAALQNAPLNIQHSALNAIQHFANINNYCFLAVKGALKFGGFENFL